MSLKQLLPFAFKDLMIRGVLQFTLRIAFCCVLHRCENQDIRCLESYILIVYSTSPPPQSRTRDGGRTHTDRQTDVVEKIVSNLLLVVVVYIIFIKSCSYFKKRQSPAQNLARTHLRGGKGNTATLSSHGGKPPPHSGAQAPAERTALATM